MPPVRPLRGRDCPLCGGGLHSRGRDVGACSSCGTLAHPPRGWRPPEPPEVPRRREDTFVPIHVHEASESA